MKLRDKHRSVGACSIPLYCNGLTSTLSDYNLLACIAIILQSDVVSWKASQPCIISLKFLLTQHQF